ncbi:hypothetical protein CEUSTIGMA_g12173.t1 [Chlamydomonas eustigma]|uniref:methenyltetrahydrofolate cyclohydrolase n=1 Tax=Chlamydomonas eustigma TaxID=1157962 RepID=A0A250XNT3_9CHLO|nr:hypothetical protein CEUSTIGMA_g12173.t1 [Chlamydomonas eustigma]|eukprot:GAX84751.1 hypothetical protein CEUSTIGMA_g12173.t1 [Chlamydomonas eustigma]
MVRSLLKIGGQNWLRSLSTYLQNHSIVEGILNVSNYISYNKLHFSSTFGGIFQCKAQQWRPQSNASFNNDNCTVLDGRRVASEWISELSVQASQLTRLMGRQPGLAVILAGRRPDSMLYVARKQEACQKVGIFSELISLSEDILQTDFEAEVKRVCNQEHVDGVLIQLPLPRHLDENALLESLDPGKDVDGFHPLNMGRLLMRGRSSCLVPCTPLGCLELLKRCGISVRGRNCVVVGDSNVVGTPLAVMLRDHGAAAVTVCHRISYTEWFEDQFKVEAMRSSAAACLPLLPGPHSPGHDRLMQRLEGGDQPSPDAGLQANRLPEITRTADILVVAIGHPELIKADWVKPGAIVVDVGINVVPPSTSLTPSYLERPASSTLSEVEQPGPSTPNAALRSRPFLPFDNTDEEFKDLSVVMKPGSYQVVGDVDFEDVRKVASALTPVPGGVGPMTIAAVLHNTMEAAKQAFNRRS